MAGIQNDLDFRLRGNSEFWFFSLSLGPVRSRHMSSSPSMQWFMRHRRVAAAWMIAAWMLLVAGTAFAQCCSAPASMPHESHAVTDQSSDSHSHDAHTGGAALECPQWLPVGVVTPDSALPGTPGDGQGAMFAAEPLLHVASVSSASFPQYYFASLPPPRSYLRFCRFLE